MLIDDIVDKAGCNKLTTLIIGPFELVGLQLAATQLEKFRSLFGLAIGTLEAWSLTDLDSDWFERTNIIV